MSQLLEPLPWDSEFFGLSIGRIIPTRLDQPTLIALLRMAQTQKLGCLYFLADPTDPTTVALVEGQGFHLVDVRVVLEHPFSDRPAPVPLYPIPANLVIEGPRANEMARLQEIASQISLTSRFYFDRRFGPRQSDQLYRVWIEKACQGFADQVFVARWGQNDEAVGLISGKVEAEVAHIQLAGVHADHRQRGVGTGLVQAALAWARANGVDRMEVVTQARNIQAQRLYQQMGFFTQSMMLYYHKWLDA